VLLAVVSCGFLGYYLRSIPFSLPQTLLAIGITAGILFALTETYLFLEQAEERDWKMQLGFYESWKQENKHRGKWSIGNRPSVFSILFIGFGIVMISVGLTEPNFATYLYVFGIFLLICGFIITLKS
jgi:hypothetical protein